MIKRTLYFSNPAYLKVSQEQLVIELIDTGEVKKACIEDLGIVILDHPQITVTQVVLHKLLENNVSLITCNAQHHPVGMFFNLDGNTLQSLKFKAQINASIPLKKQLWQQTVSSKIQNQAGLLRKMNIQAVVLQKLSNSVKSGDSENHEAQAAVYYWKNIFPDFLEFKRERFGAPPNNLLNYGYTLLRALVARSLTGSGLLPTLGIHHRNQYNAYCLADDIMEPYRPFVDEIVCEIIRGNGKFLEMTPSMKVSLLKLPQKDVIIEGKRSPLMVAVSRTTSSLAKCFEGHSRKIIYPEIS